MIHKVVVDLPEIKNIVLELDDEIAPKTVKSFLNCLPIDIGINVWGEELYTDKIPIDASEENSKPLVDLMDVAYWLPGNAICLFFGPTPIGKKGEIRPYSPVNVIGKITYTGNKSIKNIRAGTRATFRLK